MKTLQSLSIIVILLLSASVSNGQIAWQQMEGLYGGSIHTIKEGPGGSIIGLTTNATYKTVDRGLNWEKMNSLPFVMRDFFYCGETIYATFTSDASGSNTVYCSTDGMLTWTARNTGLEGLWINSVTQAGTDLYACSDSGVYKSTDNGAAWNQVYYISALKFNYIYEMKKNQKGMIFLATIAGLYRSTDNGTSWEQMNPGNEKMKSNVENFLIDSEDKILLNTPGGIFRSNDDGATWTQLGAGIIETNLGALLNPSPGTLIAARNWGGMFVSYDSGDTWKQANNISITDLILTGDGKFAAAVSSGAMFADSLTGEWRLSVKGINELMFSFIYSGKKDEGHENDIIAGGEGGIIYRSSDNGTTWNKVHKMQSSSVTSIVRGKDHMLYAGSIWGGVVRSSDDGVTWTNANQGLSDNDVRTLAVDRDGNIYAGTFSKIFKSTDNGASWSSCLSQTQSVQCSTIVINSKNEIFAGTVTFGVVMSTNGGKNWKQMDSGMELPVQYMAITNKDELYAVTVNSRLYHSDDNGENWTLQAKETGITCLFFTDNGRMLAGIDKNHEVIGMFCSTDKGKNWSEAKDGMGEQYVYCMDADASGTVYAATSMSIFKSTASLVSVDEGKETGNNNSQGAKIIIAGNSVRLTMAQDGNVLLEVFDLSGRKVKTLDNGFTGAGEHYYSVDGLGLSPGAYFIRLTVDGKEPVVLSFIYKR